MIRIGVYALAKDEAKHAAAWAEATAGADVRVVTDTGSTDETIEILQAAGVTVARSYVVPWRWDVAWTQALNHLPPDLDVAFRVDLDERPQPGWLDAIRAAWDGEANCLNYRYVWSFAPDGSPGLVFACDRVHSRSGFVWRQSRDSAGGCKRKPAFQALACGGQCCRRPSITLTSASLIPGSDRACPASATIRRSQRAQPSASFHAEIGGQIMS